MPHFPELKPFLEKARAEAPSDAVFVIDERYRKPAMTENGSANANLRTQLLRLLKRAGIEGWPRLFHERGCGSELSKNALEGGAESGTVVAQKQAQHTSAGVSTLSQESAQVVIEKGDMQDGAISCNTLHTPQMEAGGMNNLSSDNPKKPLFLWDFEQFWHLGIGCSAPLSDQFHPVIRSVQIASFGAWLQTRQLLPVLRIHHAEQIVDVDMNFESINRRK